MDTKTQNGNGADQQQNPQALVPTVPAGTLARQEFGAQEIQRIPETASVAIAAQARAYVEAKFIFAERHPRDIDVVREKWLKECSRPTLAELRKGGSCAAIYVRPVGTDTISGPTIRLAEIALRCWGNVDVDSFITYDDPEKRLIAVVGTDLETNISYRDGCVIEKTVERRFLKKNQKPISSRVNSYGEMVYLVHATDDEIRAKTNAEKSKAIRNITLRLFPGDLLEEGLDRVRQVQADKDAQDPDAAKREILDAFATLGVKPDELKIYVGHSLDGMGPAERLELRGLFAALRDGEITWAQALEEKTGVVSADAPAEKPPTDTKGLAEVLEKRKAEREAKEAAAKKAKETAAAQAKETPAAGEAKAPAAAPPAKGADKAPTPGKEG